MASENNVDTSNRTCADCSNSFKMTDYTPGYFHYKKDISKKSSVNRCPSCEITRLREQIKIARTQESRSSAEDDLRLLETKEIANEEQGRRAKRTHGT